MCCTVFLKTMMFIVNGFIFLAGAGLLGLGIWLKVDDQSLTDLLGGLDHDVVPGGLAQLANVSYLLIGVGAVLLVIGFLGCCGAMRESRCMLMTFFVILLIILIVEVAAAVLVFVFETQAEEILWDLKDEIAEQLEENYRNHTLPDLWNNMMHDFKCCGFNSYTDFGQNGTRYPDQCCNFTLVVGPPGCTAAVARESMVQGCFEGILQWIKDNAVIVGAAALGIVGVHVAAMVVSMVLYKDIGRK